ncbi:hypothetical protein BDN70DRAFT_891222, partial [Pholiota conissans]
AHQQSNFANSFVIPAAATGPPVRFRLTHDPYTSAYFAYRFASPLQDLANIRKCGSMFAYIFSNQGWGSFAGNLVTMIVLLCYKSIMEAGHTSKVDGGAFLVMKMRSRSSEAAQRAEETRNAAYFRNAYDDGGRDGASSVGDVTCPSLCPPQFFAYARPSANLYAPATCAVFVCAPYSFVLCLWLELAAGYPRRPQSSIRAQAT